LNATVDHMLSLIVFISATLLFIGVFSQSIQTGLAYQTHRSLATKTSDLLDNMLLNPGPENWGQNDIAPASFGLRDPDFAQYQLNPFSVTRLTPYNAQNIVRSDSSTVYRKSVTGCGWIQAVSTDVSVKASKAANLMGIQNTYGFQLSLTPLLNISINKISSAAPLKLQVNVDGTGFPLSNATLNYSLILVDQSGQYSSYKLISGTGKTDQAGKWVTPTNADFSAINGDSRAFSFLVYVYLAGVSGVGFYVNTPSATTKNVVPLIESFSNRTVTLAHSDLLAQAPAAFHPQLSYNATFFLLGEDFTLRQIPLNQPNSTGALGEGSSQNYAVLSLPANYGILSVTYKDPSGNCGVALMPWGCSCTASQIVFGDSPTSQEWVSTDIRQVTIGGISYQAKLALWSVEGHMVNGQ
jgi:hypothetical protein